MRLSSGTIRRRRLLLVDPDAVYRAGLEEPLEMGLWSVVGHADSDAALAWLADNPQLHIDAVWCEAGMHDATGEDLIAGVQRVRPAVPVIIVTAAEVSQDLLAAGVMRFSKKDTPSAVRWLVTLDEPEKLLAISD